MKVTTSELFCDMMEYLPVPAARPACNGGNSVTIINNTTSRVRKPEPTDGKVVTVLLKIQMAIETLGMLFGIIQVVPPLVRSINYPMHASALSKAKQYRIDNPSKGELTKPKDIVTARIVDKYTSIVSHNCAKAKKLLVAGTVFTGAAVAHEVMQPRFAFSTKIITSVGEKLPGVVKTLVTGLGSKIGVREAKIAMGVSAAFGLVSAAWHTLRAPSLGEQYYQDIRNRSGLAQ